MRCYDGHLYVVKFQSNPQRPRVLVNEMVVTRIAHLLGLPVPAAQVVEVRGWLIQHSPEMTVQLGNHTQPLDAGLHFGSRHLLPSSEGQMLDWMPESLIPLVRNLATFAGILALDKWTC